MDRSQQLKGTIHTWASINLWEITLSEKSQSQKVGKMAAMEDGLVFTSNWGKRAEENGCSYKSNIRDACDIAQFRIFRVIIQTHKGEKI